MLKDFGLVYLYLANNSSDESWKNVRHFEKKMTLLSRKLRRSKSVFLIRKSRIRIRMVEA